MIALLGCSLEVAAAGILTARKQFTFLVGAMLLSLGAVFAYTSAHRTHSWGLTGVWWGERQFSLANFLLPGKSSWASEVAEYCSCLSPHLGSLMRPGGVDSGMFCMSHRMCPIQHLALRKDCPHGSLSGKLLCARLVVVPSFACHVYIGFGSGLHTCKERAGSPQSPRHDIKRSAQQPAPPVKPGSLQAEGLWACQFEQELCEMSCSHRQLPLQAWSSSLGCAACRV